MESPIHLLDVIVRKRDGKELSGAEIEAFVRAVVRSPEPLAGQSGEAVSEAQIASFLMAVYQRGLSDRELSDLTQAMRFSGDVLDLNTLGGFTVDKHSTGGVGDKTSLLIAPILAAAGMEGSGPGIYVPMISGRSLGHTGGTLEKLETIPGFQTQLSLERMEQVLRECHAVMVGQTPRLVPADRVLYALRDHTGTVESPHLITASIMSKKLAEDLHGLVLDVKVGSGAFMPSDEAAEHLARLMVTTGERAGTRTVALLTSMDEPLGRFAGNWLEVWECVDVLRGVRHPMSADLIELACALSGWMLHLAGGAATPAAGAQQADTLLRDGRAYAAWLRIVAAQGGDPSVFDNPEAFHQPRARRTFSSKVSGFFADIDCREVGWAVQRLGAGRHRPGDPVSTHAGLEVHAKLGDRIEAGQPMFTLFSEHEELLEEPYRMIGATVRVGTEPIARQPLIRQVVRVPEHAG